MIILLDTGPLGMLTNPNATPKTRAARDWLKKLLAASAYEVQVPEIADYEHRRELLRAGLTAAIGRLDALKQAAGYVPISTDAMLQAAQFWAQARNMGQQTARDAALDGDMILSAQAHVLQQQLGEHVVIATENVGHLSLFADARDWNQIRPA